MIKEPSRSLMPAKEIEGYLKKNYNVTKYLVHLKNNRELNDIYIEVTSQKQGYIVTTPMRFMEKDILDLVAEILDTKNIKYEEFKTGRGHIVVEHVDGDSRESHDVGSIQFTGVIFTWKEEE